MERRNPFELSLIDKLSDDDDRWQAVSSGGSRDRGDAYRENIRRDVEALLNAHRRFLPVPDIFGEASNSLLEFGVPDFSNEGYSTKDHREQLRLELEKTLARHEPRLAAVSVEIPEMKDRKEQVIQFKITARLKSSEDGETILFDTSVMPSDLSVIVEDAG